MAAVAIAKSGETFYRPHKQREVTPRRTVEKSADRPRWALSELKRATSGAAR
jgi:hypothetical protein